MTVSNYLYKLPRSHFGGARQALASLLEVRSFGMLVQKNCHCFRKRLTFVEILIQRPKLVFRLAVITRFHILVLTTIVGQHDFVQSQCMSVKLLKKP